MIATAQGLLDGTDLPRSETLMLLSHASGLTRERLIAGSRDALDPGMVVAFRALAARRQHGEPIAYLVGAREFYGRTFAVDHRVLIPRPETELVVELALSRIDLGGVRRVLDLGTGSGAIAVTLALERPGIDIVASDRSDAALAVARGNARRHGAELTFAAGDWFDALDRDAAFDLIVSNPPYVAAGDPHLSIGDLRFEPSGALTDGADGLTAIRQIVDGAPSWLAHGGSLMVEHGHGQARAARLLFAVAGLVDIASHADLAGIERVTIGQRIGGRTVL